MYRLLIRSGLAVVFAAQPMSAFAQKAAPAPDLSLDAPQFDPTTPMSDIPEIDDEWNALFSNENEAVAADLTTDGSNVAELRYDFDPGQITGHGIVSEFRAISALVAGRSKPVPSLAELHRRTRVDADAVRRLLRAKGYFDPEISFEIVPGTNGGKLNVLARLEPGPLYKFEDVVVNTPPDAPRQLIDDTLTLKAGDALAAESVTAARNRLILTLSEKGHPFAKVSEPEIIVDHDSRTAHYTIDVDPGPAARFGEISVAGERLFSVRHVRRLARFKTGDTYDSSKIEDLRRALIATGLISTVDIKTAPVPESDSVDVTVTLTPAPLRTLAGQVGYSTTDGFRLEASWQHRNLLPPQGAVTFRGVLATQEQSLAAELRRPNWKKRDRTLGVIIQARNEDRQAYYARSLTGSTFLERETNLVWQKKWIYRIGGEVTLSQERDRSMEIGRSAPLRTYLLAAAPLTLGYDGSDDLLDPKRGFRLTGRASPEASFQDGVFGYVKALVDASLYLPLANDKLVLAGRTRIGAIIGAERGRIAPSRRFYAGGGGSVRGYGYQEVGPLDPDNDPLGGRSISEFSVEARYRIGNFGVVPFFDVGQVDTNAYPRFKNMRAGAGIGARYYTNFGPIRIDIATPIDKRPIDPRVAVYVSIGQAF